MIIGPFPHFYFRLSHTAMFDLMIASRGTSYPSKFILGGHLVIWLHKSYCETNHSYPLDKILHSMGDEKATWSVMPWCFCATLCYQNMLTPLWITIWNSKIWYRVHLYSTVVKLAIQSNSQIFSNSLTLSLGEKTNVVDKKKKSRCGGLAKKEEVSFKLMLYFSGCFSLEISRF